MFSENQKISVRQMTRLLVYDMIGISTLLLPRFLAGRLGADGFFALFLALIPAFAVVWLLERSVAGSWKDFGEHMRRIPLWLRIPILVFYICEGVLAAGYGVYLLGDLILQHLLPNESYWLIISILILLGGYGIWRGMEGRARVYEILFWILMAPLLLMLLLAAKDVDTWYWTPVFSHGLWEVLLGTGAVFLFYLIVIFAFFLTPYLQNSRMVGYSCRRSLLTAAALNGAVYLVLLGNFGANALSSMPYAVIDLMSMVKLPGGFFERQDAFMVAIWFFTLYAFINTGMFYASDILRFLVKGRAADTADNTGQVQDKQEERQRETRLQRWSVAAVMVLTFAVAAVLYLGIRWREYYDYFQMYAAAPLFILILLGLQYEGRRKGHEA